MLLQHSQKFNKHYCVIVIIVKAIKFVRQQLQQELITQYLKFDFDGNYLRGTN